MQTLKLNSKGTEVQILQSLLHLTPDGTFGPKTLEAVKAFQRQHSLTPDGICGAKTWAALGILTAADLARAQAALTGGVQTPSPAPTPSQPSSAAPSPSGSSAPHADTPAITLLPLHTHITRKPNRPILYLAIHYTAGSRSTAGSARAVHKVFTSRSASADFAVDDKEILQFNADPKNYYCWAVGDKRNPGTGGASLNGKALNSNTISIEMCSSLDSGTTAAVPNHSGWHITEATFQNTVRLARHLMKKYNIPLSRVVRHYDITGKLCPGVSGWNNGPLYDPRTGKRIPNATNTSPEWQRFLKALQ